MSADEKSERRFHLMTVMGRLQTGRTAAEAESELGTLYSHLQSEHPDTTADWSARVTPLRDFLLGESPRALGVLGGAVLVLVIVAWLNLAALLVAWLPTRRQELLVRLAVGATRFRIVRQLVIETLLWASIGAAGGLALAGLFVRLFGAIGVAAAVPYGFDFQPKVDLRVLLTSAAFLLVSVGATAIGPCVLAVFRSADQVPRRARAAGRVGRRFSLGLQVALSILLLSSAVGLLTGFRQLATMAPGAGTEHALAIEVSRPEMGDDAAEARDRAFFEALLAALAHRGELRAVGAASYVPPTVPLGNVRFSIEGRATSTEAQTALASAVDPSAFGLLGIPLVRGRLVADGDGATAPHVAVVSAALARRYWPDEDPVGRRITLVSLTEPSTIVGVVGDVRQPLSKDPRAESVLYLPYRQFPWPFMTLLVAPAGDTAPAIAAVRQEVARLDPAQAVGSVRRLDEMRSAWLVQPRLRTAVVTLFALATLLLTLVGLQASVAHGVTTRSRELAVRQALGARPVDVIRLLILEALAVVGAGLVLGLSLLPTCTGALRHLVGDVAALDPERIAAVTVLIAVGALVSTYWPARRAGRVDPARLLVLER